MTDDSSISEHQQAVLDAFLVDNPELVTLNARLSAFNLFHVLRVAQVEIRHSNVLAWLMTPEESHGLGPIFLRRFMSRLLMASDLPSVSMTASQVELMDLRDIEVHREWNNVDVLVRSRSERWCLLLENKIKASESHGQLCRYRERVEKEMPGWQVVGVYLTLDGDDPSDEAAEIGFVPWSHDQVLQLTEQLIEQNRSRIPSDALVFLGHYLDTLRRLTMQDQQLIDLCKTIYRRHREAIELIVEYGASSEIADNIESALRETVACEFIDQKRGSVWFLPSALGQVAPRVDLTTWGFLPRPTPIACWFRYGRKRGNIHGIIEIGPIADSDIRISLMKALRAAGFNIREHALRPEAKYTRIVSITKKLRAGDDGEVDDSEEYIKSVTKELWGKVWEKGQAAVDVLAKVRWTE